MMKDVFSGRTIHLPNDAEPSDKRGTLYWITLFADDLDIRVNKALEQYEQRYAKYFDLLHDKAQPAEEYRTLKAFQNRLENVSNPEMQLEIRPGELPISFNDEVFDGNFVLVECCRCGRKTEPSGTVLNSFSDSDGMQYYGWQRFCPCGQSIGHKIEGYRRP